MLIAASGMLLSPLGLWLAHRLDKRWLSVLFAMILLLVAFCTFRRVTRLPVAVPATVPSLHPCECDTTTGRFIWTSSGVRALALSGTVAGLLSGLPGVGGGLVMVPALQRYTDLVMRSVVATSLAVIALVSVPVSSPAPPQAGWPGAWRYRFPPMPWLACWVAAWYRRGWPASIFKSASPLYRQRLPLA